MSMPGFTAEQAVGRALHTYRNTTRGSSSMTNQAIWPMQGGECGITCPDGSSCQISCTSGQCVARCRTGGAVCRCKRSTGIIEE
jgi:hypothetical protein